MKKFYSVFILTILFSTSSFSQGYELWGWGLNDKGQLGDGKNTKKLNPNLTLINSNSFVEFHQISTGDSYTMFIKADGSLWGWGNNNYGQLGIGNTTNKNIPIQVGNDYDWEKVVCSKAYNAEHTIAIKKDGTLWAWGNNSSGQLGDGTNNISTIPKRIGNDSNWKYIDVVFGHSLAIKKDGTLWAWGNNSSSQLGIGTKINERIPVQVGSDSDWVQVSAGRVSTLALKKDGTIWAWGDNPFGQLGDGPIGVNVNKPKQVGIQNDWIVINSGYDNSFAIKKDGSLWSWGYNFHGQLGIGNTDNQSNPQQVGTSKWLVVNAGNWHTTGIQADGNVYTWASNVHGQLGDGTLNDILVPKKITTNGKWVSVQGGGGHTFAVNAPSTYSLSGYITNKNNKFIKSVEIELILKNSKFVTLTDSTGYYNFTGLTPNVYAITPKATNSYTFSPVSKTVTVNNSNINIGLDFELIEKNILLQGKFLIQNTNR